jgi:hypothetical protein
MPQPPRFLLITPTTSEYGPVEQAVAQWLAAGQIQLEMCGVGPARAAAFAVRLEGAGPWGGMALIGWAGGLKPELKAGDVVVADVAIGDDGRQAPCTAIDLPGATRGALLTVGDPLLTPENKRRAGRSGALGVEMEAYPLAAWAAAHQIPFVHARVILDGVNETLPPMGGVLDPSGNIRLGRLARLLAARPNLVLELWPMVRRMRRVRPTLAALARQISEAWLR